jgi:hypothetical protein
VSELSQAERTAMEIARDAAGIPKVLRDERAFLSGWLVGRDYGRERERKLEEALAEALEYVPAYFREKWNLDDPLAASHLEIVSGQSGRKPREPEQRSSYTLRKPTEAEIEAGGEAINDLLQMLAIDGQEVPDDHQGRSIQDTLASAVLEARVKACL